MRYWAYQQLGFSRSLQIFLLEVARPTISCGRPEFMIHSDKFALFTSSFYAVVTPRGAVIKLFFLKHERRERHRSWLRVTWRCRKCLHFPVVDAAETQRTETTTTSAWKTVVTHRRTRWRSNIPPSASRVAVKYVNETWKYDWKI